MTRLIRQTIAAWLRFRFLRSNPTLRQQIERRDAAKRAHRATKKIEREMQQHVLKALRNERAA